MDERVFARLAERLHDDPVVVASVLATRGAVPRRTGSRMLVTAHAAEFSVGGGMLELKAIAAARALLRDGGDSGEVAIDLTGRPGASGVCGGTMRIALKRWHGADALARAQAIAHELQAGRAVVLTGDDLGAAGAEQHAQPDERLLIIGAGHCGAALHDIAGMLDFERWVYDPRSECFEGGQFAGATVRCGEASLLRDALATPRTVYAVLLNRDYPSDVAALRVLAEAPPPFIAMMGSRKRIKEVMAALDDTQRSALAHLQAPVGIEIEAETPHEIAVSIAAQLIARRRVS